MNNYQKEINKVHMKKNLIAGIFLIIIYYLIFIFWSEMYMPYQVYKMYKKNAIVVNAEIIELGKQKSGRRSRKCSFVKYSYEEQEYEAVTPRRMGDKIGRIVEIAVAKNDMDYGMWTKPHLRDCELFMWMYPWCIWLFFFWVAREIVKEGNAEW